MFYLKRLVLILCFITVSKSFETGFKYSYLYEIDTYELPSFSKTTSNVERSLTSLSLPLNIEVLDKKENDLVIAVKFSSNDEIGKYPIICHFENNLIRSFNLSSKDSKTALNLKKGLCELLNFNEKEKHGVSLIANCDNQYTRNYEKDRAIINIKKIKKNCAKTNFYPDETKHNDKLFDVFIDRHIETNFKISSENNVFQSIESIEIVKFGYEIEKSLTKRIKSRQNLKFISSDKFKNSKKDFDGLDLFIEKITFDRINVNENPERIDIKQAINEHIKTMAKEKRAKNSTSTKILKLVRLLRHKDIETEFLSNILKQNENSEKLLQFLIDSFVAAQTDSAFQALLSYLKLNENNSFDGSKTYLIEKVFITGSYISHSTLKELFQVLMNIITSNRQHNDLVESAYFAISSVVKTMRAKKPQYKEFIQEYLKTIESKLSNCNEDKCTDFLLNALSNAKLEESIKIFKNEIKNCNFSKRCRTSIKALRKFSNDVLPKNTFNSLFEIFEKKSNLSDALLIRIEALDFILNKYSSVICSNQETIQKIINEIDTSNIAPENNFEFSYFSFKTVMNNLHSDSVLRNAFIKVDPGFDYKVLQLTGKSSVSNRKFSTSSDGKIDFSFKQFVNQDDFLDYLELGVNLESNEILDLVKLEIFTDNLKAISNQELGDPSASVELSIMDRKIKRAMVFNSYSDLVNILWNAPSSLKSIFDTNFLINDQNEIIWLSNGFMLNMKGMGVFSFDISAAADVSIWSQTATTLLKVAAALRIENTIKLIPGLNIPTASLDLDFATQVATKLNSDMDFSGTPMKLCMKFLQDKIKLEAGEKCTRMQKGRVKKVKRERSLWIQPSTFIISKKTTEYCQ